MIEQEIIPGLEATNHDEYELFRGHSRTDGSFKTDEQLRSEYVELTDELIRQMTEGVSFTDPETGEITQERPDVVVWLDKSARPVSWLAKELWPTLAKDKNGEVPEMPDFRFVNIDREQWVNAIDPNGSGVMNVDRIDKSIIRSLRSVFIQPNHKQNGLTDDIDSAPSVLDGKKVLIVDEVYASGRTLSIAQQFFKRAFPTAQVSGTYWMRGVTTKNGAQGNADLPVWYKEDDWTGRGVSDRDERLAQQSASITQRLGAWFLSNSLKEPDPNSNQLRHEIKQLGNDVRTGNMLVVPSLQRDIDDYDERVARFNHGMNIDEFASTKRAQDEA